MDKNHCFGFWREHSGDAFPSVLSASRQVLSEEKANLVAQYLSSCPVWIASPGVEFSGFNDGAEAGTGSVCTDGAWAWQDTMAYYVRQYKIAPPVEFLHHIECMGYSPPSQVDVASLEFPEDMGG